VFLRLALFVLFIGCQVGVAAAEDNGLELLDEAVEVKVGAERAEDLEQVVTLCEKALEAGLGDENAQFAKLMITSTLYERANRYVDFVLEGQSRHMWAQRRQLAMQDLNRLRKHDADHAEAHLLIARLQLLPGGDVDEGRKSAERALELLEDQPERLSVALVVSASFVEETEKKLELYEKAIAEDADNLEAWRERGETKLVLGNTEEAIADFIHLLSKDDQDVEALQSIAQAFADQEKYDEALEKLNKAISLAPDEPSVYTLRSRIRILQNDIDGAIEDLNEALRKEPRDVGALLMRATLRESKREFDAALADVQRVLELRPGLNQALLVRCFILFSAGRQQEAISEFKQLVRRDPENVELLLRLAAMFTANNQPSRAIEIYTEALGVSAGNAQALHGRADALLSIGKHAEAIKDYELALDSSPEDVSSILNNLAWVMATSTIDEVRDGKRAIELAKKACEETAYEAAHILSTLAAAYAEEGDFQKALEWSTKAVELGEGDVREQLQGELDSYNEGKPWREMQKLEERSEAETPDLSDLEVDKEEDLAGAVVQNESQVSEDATDADAEKADDTDESKTADDQANQDDAEGEADQEKESKAAAKKKLTDADDDIWAVECTKKHKKKKKDSDKEAGESDGSEQKDSDDDEADDEEADDDEAEDDEADDDEADDDEADDEEADDDESDDDEADDEEADDDESDDDEAEDVDQQDTDDDACLFFYGGLIV